METQDTRPYFVRYKGSTFAIFSKFARDLVRFANEHYPEAPEASAQLLELALKWENKLTKDITEVASA